MADAPTPGSPPPPLDPESNRPEDTAYKQQRLGALQPTMSPPFIVGCFAVISIIFIPIGATIIIASDGIVEYSPRYDHLQNCPPSARLPSLNYACAFHNITLIINQTMRAPVFMSYQLENFYQNHRRYGRSKSDTQLAGDVTTPESWTDCAPFQYVGQFIDLGANNTVLFDSSTTVDLRGVYYYPCGLIPWSMFNDSFILTAEEVLGSTRLDVICDGENFNSIGERIDPTSSLNCEKKGITWPSDVGTKFVGLPTDPGIQSKFLSNVGWPRAPANTSLYSQHVRNGWYVGEEGHKIPNPLDEDLMVWMRIGSLSTFRKLYRRITTTLLPGTYQVAIRQRSDYRAFGGKKSFVLSTTSWIGGKNYFLGGLYVAVGSSALITSIGFLVKYVTTPRRVGSL